MIRALLLSAVAMVALGFAVAPVALIILVCASAAAYRPARRAVQTDPIAAIPHQ